METSLTLTDLAEVNRAPLAHLAQMGKGVEPADEGSRSAFRQEVVRVQDRLKQFYQLGALTARRAKEPAAAADVWRAVSQFADETLAVLSALRDRSPHSGAPELYDMALEYKAAALKRAQLNEGAARCQTTPAPAGLFPETP